MISDDEFFESKSSSDPDDEYFEGKSSSDWYDTDDSDAEKEIPNPNDWPENLYQDINKLPEPLKKEHFQEGILYFMTLNATKKRSSLGMVIEVRSNKFIWRNYGIRGSSQKTYHESGKDNEHSFDEVWRLAPRRELMIPRSTENIRTGQTLNFQYENDRFTVRVLASRSTSITAIIETGANRGETTNFERIEIVDCLELFVSSLLHDMHDDLSSLMWTEDKTATTYNFPSDKPSLKPGFFCPEPIQNKRL